MGGLLQRAAAIRENQRKLRLVKAESDDAFDEIGGTPEERLEIIERIDGVIRENQGEIGPETFRVTAKRRGIALPLLVNLAAVLVLAVGAWFLIRAFQSREESVAAGEVAFVSAEGRLLTQLRAESEAALSEKESEIESIQAELSQIAAEREQIEQSINDRLSSQEAALRQQFDAALAAERTRLEESELSQAEIDAQLAEFEREREAEFASELEAVREAAAAELAEQEASLNARISETEQLLADAQNERLALQAQLEQEREAAAELLGELQDRQRQEQLVQDRIVQLYSDVEADLSAGRFDAALEGTEELRSYLAQGNVAALPAVSRRRQVESFLVDTLEERIIAEQTAAQPDTEGLSEAASVISEVTELVASAETAYGASEFDNARSLYLAALAEIPAVSLGYERLTELEAQADQAENQRIAAIVREANSLYRAGNYSQAAETYGDALATLPAADAGLLSRVLDAGYQLRQTGDLDELRTVRADLQAARDLIAEREATLERQAEEIARQEQEISGLRTQIATLQTELEELQAAPAVVETTPDPAQAERIEELQSELASLRTQLASATSDLEDARAEAEEQAATIAEQLATINRQRATIAARDAEITDLRGSVSTISAELSATEDALDDTQDTLSDTRDELAATRAELATTESDLADTRAALSESEASVGRLQQTTSGFETYITFYEEQQQLAREIARYQERFAEPLLAEEAAEDEASLALLETKLLILRILGTDAVQARYPDLADQFDLYLDALVAEQRAEERLETIAEVNAVLDFLVDDARTVQSAVADQFPPALEGTGDENARFFDLLETLVEPAEE